MRLSFLTGAVFLSVLFGISFSAQAGWEEQTLLKQLKVISPKSGIERLEVKKCEVGEIFGVVVNYRGGPLPARRTMVLELEPPLARRSFSVHIISLDPYWTQPYWSEGLSQIPTRSQFVVWEEAEGKFGAMIPLVGGGLNSWLEGDGKKLLIISESRANNFAPSRVPVLALGWGEDLYSLIEELYGFGLKLMKEVDPEGVIGKLRVEKKYPEIFRYLGWCSWNTYYTGVDEEKLFASAKDFQESKVPIRWIIIDDGWQPVTKTKPVANPIRNKSLTGFEANPQKFPKGLAYTIKVLKEDYGIKWVGVWHTFQGYWNGIALNSELGKKYRDTLLAVSEEVGIPDPRSKEGEKFWEDYYQFLSQAGADFVKTDNQSELAWYLNGVMPASLAMANAQRNHKGPSERYFNLNVLDCMSTNIDTVYQWEKTNLSRVSNDYDPYRYNNPRIHTVKCLMNSLWFQNLTYPDFDMWMTHKKYALYHSVSRAISGGPVYLTDEPGKHRWELVYPLIYSDGEVIRTEAPALPALQSIWENPYTSGKPLVAFARVKDAGILALWNVNTKYLPVSTELSAEDIYGIKGERFAVYDYFSGELTARGRAEKFKVNLKGWEVRLYSVVPIKEGFAGIGLLNKYLSPATINWVKREPGKVSLELKEAGTLGAYSEQKPIGVKVNGKELSKDLIKFSPPLLKLDLPKAPGKVWWRLFGKARGRFDNSRDLDY